MWRRYKEKELSHVRKIQKVNNDQINLIFLGLQLILQGLHFPLSFLPFLFLLLELPVGISLVSLQLGVKRVMEKDTLGMGVIIQHTQS